MAMAPRKIRKAIRPLKDQTSISIAKVGGTKAPDLDVALVRATSHDDYFDDKYANEILNLTSHSRGYVNACMNSLTKRISKTHDWNVACKCLMLIHRLLREGDPAFEDELMRASRHGKRILNLSHFRDATHSNAWDYTAFVRTYGLYLDERLDCSVSISSKNNNHHHHNNNHRSGQSERRSAFSRSPPPRSGYGGGRSPGRASSRYGGSPESRYSYSDDRRHSNYDGGLSPRYGDRSGRSTNRGDWNDRSGRNDREEEGENVPVKEMNAKQLLDRLPAMQMLMERVLGCRPAGAAKTNRLVQVALYLVVKESIQLHKDLCDGMTVLLDAFFDMEQLDRVRAFDLYYRYAKQSEELEDFFKICKQYGVGRSSEYIAVELVPKERLETLEEFLRSNAPSGRSKSPEPQPLQLEYKPQTPEREPEPVACPITPEPAPPPEVIPEEAPTVPEPEPEPEEDLLDMGKATISAEEEGNKLALALFSGTTTNGTWESFTADEDQQSALRNASEHGKAGWELALVASVSNLSKPTNAPMAGGFDPLLLDSMYSQGAVLQKQAANAMPAGSASSVAIPNRPASSFLALPAPPGGMPLPVTGEDPFAASALVPPPPYVQMADLTKKQQLLTQEQVMWQQYQTEGMRGEAGFMKLFNNPYASVAPQSTLSLPHYNMGMPVAGYYAPY